MNELRELEPVNTADAEKLDLIKKYREQDCRYLELMTKKYGCDTARDLCCLSISGHTDIDRLTDNEWVQFRYEYNRIIDKLVLVERDRRYV